MNGWLNIYKPLGISSAKVVYLIKKAINKKVGHAGTLDVEAEGVLPVAIGEATKLIRILVDAKKTYKFTIKFGEQTDTGDKAGKIISTTNHIPSRDECYAVCKHFIGKIEQIPPAYSAIKVNGQRAYKLARQDQEVIIAKRVIEIYDITCIGYDEKNKTASYICTCSKGTYIRTLAEDIAFNLQSLGFVISLARLKVGIFEQEKSIICPKDNRDVESFINEIDNYLLPSEHMLKDIPVIDVSREDALKVRNGQKISIANKNIKTGIDDLIWLREDNKDVVAIGCILEGSFKSLRVFNLVLKNSL